jgi:GDP-L-fucose synthase
LGLAQSIQKVVGYVGKIRFDSSKPDGTIRKWLDSRKLKKLGWEPKVELESGLKMTYKQLVDQNGWI